ncbi:LamG-like jellyroll fold domain-containing protein [Streptoalloteichus hindustanus]|uniref:YD repeat-containing protein n=1 Tax=Streptoalloteichus hindustanus TaxID=2017 RepID=A0A1M5BBK5_STRHI|nr:PA14 domain-containing protein [Streptoalloteichus hindustanus]SHF39894.1 YD repeat-containing protein [Streptoalloteichus hindustanus]
MRVPATGSYVFGGQHDDGMRVWIGNDLVFDEWSTWMGGTEPPRFGTAKQLEVGKYYPIRVEYQEHLRDAFVRLWAKKDVDAPVEVPSSWLSPTAATMPPGWSVSADLDGTGTGYTKAALTDSTVVLTDTTGAAHTYTKLADGGYAPPAGEYGTLSRDGDGKLTLIDSDGTTYVFDSSGNIVSITSPVDARKPAAARMEWTTPDASNPIPRLTKIIDPVSNRAITLHYSGSQECPKWTGYDWPPPPGFLCTVALPDGAKSHLYYLNGRLAQLQNPGAELTQFSFNSVHLLDQMRTSASMDWIVVDPQKRDTQAPNHRLGYDGQKRALWVEAPEPTGVDQKPTQRPRHDYSYGPDWTEVDVAGVSPASGYSRRVTRDAAGRMLVDTDATGKAGKHEWADADKELSKTDAAGRKTTTIYDAKGNPVETYGPAPEACFGGDRRPKSPAPAGCDKIPSKRTSYDEGMTGLSAAWWSNATMSGPANSYNTSGPNTDWSANAPAEGLDLKSAYSGRLTGQLQVDSAGSYMFGTAEDGATDGMRFYVDDNLVVDRTYAPNVVESKPRGYWRLGDNDETARDSSGNGRNGTYSGSVARQRDGAMPDDNSRAVDFSGGKVEIPHHDALNLTGAMSVEMWVKPRVVENAHQMLINKVDNASGWNASFDLVLRPDFKLDFLQGAGTTAGPGLSTETLAPNHWNHVVVTRDSQGKVAYYINGKKAGEGTPGAKPGANAAPVRIGARVDGNTAQTLIDEVAVYDRPLSEKEVSKHMGAAGRVNQGRQAIALSAGPHRLRIDYIRHALSGNQTRGSNGIDFTWRKENGFDWAKVPADKLTPDYGLTTSTVELDSDSVPEHRSTTNYREGLDPAYGLAGSSTSDPGGLRLTTKTAYEKPGNGYLRRVGKQTPSGAATVYSHYGNTETRDNPCTSAVDPIPQSGLAKGSTGPKPASGPARTEEQVYDLRGRVIAESAGGGGWICTRYDERGRVVEKTYPANSTAGERKVVHDYKVGGDPLTTSVGDVHGTATTKADLLGRTVSYTDV